MVRHRVLDEDGNEVGLINESMFLSLCSQGMVDFNAVDVPSVVMDKYLSGIHMLFGSGEGCLYEPVLSPEEARLRCRIKAENIGW